MTGGICLFCLWGGGCGDNRLYTVTAVAMRKKRRRRKRRRILEPVPIQDDMPAIY